MRNVREDQEKNSFLFIWTLSKLSKGSFLHIFFKEANFTQLKSSDVLAKKDQI